MKAAKEIAWVVVLGFFIMAGIRVAEYAIPEPASRIVICYGAKGTEPLCLPMAELLQMIEDAK